MTKFFTAACGVHKHAFVGRPSRYCPAVARSPMDSSGRLESAITLGQLRIWPFATCEDHAGTFAAAAERLFRAWALQHYHLYGADASAPATQAAAHAFTLIDATSTTCLRVRLSATPPTATVHLSLRPPIPVGELARPSEALRCVFWHFVREEAQSAPEANRTEARDADACGFAGCAARCLPSRDHKPYKLERVFAASTIATAPSTVATQPSTPFVSSPSQNLPPAGSTLHGLPDEVLLQVALRLQPRCLSALSRTSDQLAAFVEAIVPGLRLRMFPHQVHALGRMLAMESPPPVGAAVPLLHRIQVAQGPEMVIVADLVQRNLFCLDEMPVLRTPRGGLFCDEPGLGKTITALALVLKTLGTQPAAPENKSSEEAWIEALVSTDEGPLFKVVKSYSEAFPERYRPFADDIGKRFASRRALLFCDSVLQDRRFSRRAVRRPDFLVKSKGVGSVPLVQSSTKSARVFLSPATIIVVPNVLTDHWLHQINGHVSCGMLRVLVVLSAADFPRDPATLATEYDVVIASFEAVSQLFSAVRDGTPSLMWVHFLRIIVDEGHVLSGANISNFGHVCMRIRAERRWVMTGTPTPSISSSDLDHLHSLLAFIREEGYGMDKRAWNIGVRDPYAQFRAESLERLGELLNRVMIRSDKSVLESKCHIKNVLIDFDTEQASGYNWLVSLTRRNLITSDWYSEKHQQSLLNSKNSSLAQKSVRNLQYASNISGTQRADFPVADVTCALDELYEKFREKAKIEEKDRFDDPVAEWQLFCGREATDEDMRRKQADIKARVKLLSELGENNKPYLRLARQHKKPAVTRVYSGLLYELGESFLNCTANCARCHEFTTIPMVTPCGHLLCENCVISDRTKCVAQHCGQPYRLDEEGVPEDLIELQPAAYSRDDWKPHWDERRSAKMAYLLERIRGLPMNEEWMPYESKPRRTRPKIIIHSQFRDHLYYLVIHLKGSRDLADSYVEMTTNRMDIDDNRRRKKATALAQEAIQEFRDKPGKHILVMTTRDGSVGLDLSFVQYIFMLEPVWDLSSELQIVSRAHRIGAKQDIYVERLVMRGSVEHEMMRDLGRKMSGQAEVVALNAEGEKDLSKVRKILRELKPVEGGTRAHRNAAAHGQASKRPRVDDGEESNAKRRVRFRSEEVGCQRTREKTFSAEYLAQCGLQQKF